MVLLLLLAPAVAFASLHDEVGLALEKLVAEELLRERRKGVATYYADRFIGRRTSTGEIYRPGRLTAAHATLPLGTVVRVENLSNSLEVVVRINDRCHPRHAPRNLIDLSHFAASRIGLLEKGITKVIITPLPQFAALQEELLLTELSE